VTGIRVFVLVGMLVLLCGIVSAEVYFSCEMGPFVKHSDYGYYTVFGYDNYDFSGDPIMKENVHFYNSKTWYAYNKARCASGNGFEIGDNFYGGSICTEKIFDDRCAEIDLDKDDDGYNFDDDCDDDNFYVNPGMTEICGDGIDNDCSGEDEECVVLNTYYGDGDGDTYGDDGESVEAESVPAGYVENNWDCDDDASIYPGQPT